MFELDSIRELHIEPTERCNARCPMCGRNDRRGQVNSFLRNREISLSHFQKFFPRDFLSSLQSVRLCGNFGDPAAARETYEILAFLRSVQPGLQLRMNTNGSLRPASWWFRLGRLFRGKNDSVQFAIDGLEDTHERYRLGTRFSTIVENAEAFIRGGGRAHWVFLVFEHNEHQIEAAAQRARELGFEQFTLKSTKRFLGSRSLKVNESIAVYSESGDKLYSIRPPRDPSKRNPMLGRIEDRRREGLSVEQLLDRTAIHCKAVERNGLFVSAGGLVFPCCWLAAALYPLVESAQSRQLSAFLDRHGGIEALSLHERTLEQIVGSAFFHELPHSWNTSGLAAGKLQICARVCGREIDAFESQFLREQRWQSPESARSLLEF
jgi:MoaA/NifB/PqqE/SkfB family radical SAM enzyme